MSGIASKPRGSSGIRQHGPSHQNRVDLPTLWHCIIASLHQKPRGTSGPHQQIQRLTNCGKREKNRVARKISAEGARELHEHGAHGSGYMLRDKAQETHPTTVLPSSV